MRILRNFVYPAAMASLFAMAAGGCTGDESELFEPDLSKDKGDSAAANKLRTLGPDAQIIPGRYIVKLNDDMVPRIARDAESNIRNVALSLMAERDMSGAAIEHIYSSAISGFVAGMSEAQALRVAADPVVELVEPDQIVTTQVTWGLDRMDQRDLPLDDVYSPDYPDGTGVHAYIIDTGILLSHTEFAGRLGNGFDAVIANGDANDCNGHGTHVAGTVGGTSYGMAPDVTLHPVRVLSCEGSGSNSGVIAGVDWVTQNHVKPAVANMSLGGGASDALDQAIANSIADGVVYAVAAGNDNRNACSYSPARLSAAVTVGSTTSADARSSFSNFGPCVDVFAPGSSITSAWHTGSTATNTISGTSMASPHVAGAIARFLSAEGNGTRTPSEVASALFDEATPGKVTSAGSGSPNRLLYVGSSSATPPPPPPPPTTPPSDVLQDGVPVTGLAGASSEWLHYTMEVPESASNLSFRISGGTGDADLYVRFGSQPTSTLYDCWLDEAGNDESCTIDDVQVGTYHVSIRGYFAFSGVTLSGNYDADTYPGAELSEGGLAATQGAWIYRELVVPSDVTKLTVTIQGSAGDADLYVLAGEQPTQGRYGCRPYLNGSNETCSFTALSAGTYHIGVRAYQSFSGLTLTADYQ